MSANTIGIVVTDNKDVFDVCGMIQDALKTLFSPYARFGDKSKNRTSTIPTFGFHASTRIVTVKFVFRGEDRMIHVHFDCDCDVREYGDKSLILSLGAWGSSELIMRTVLHALSGLGPTYIDVNDCDNVDFERIDEEAVA